MLQPRCGSSPRRYACTVCPHRPVFDTLEVLAVHRAGRKHVGSECGAARGAALGGGGGGRVSAPTPPLPSFPGLRRCYGGSRAQEAAVRERQCQEVALSTEVGAEPPPLPRPPKGGSELGPPLPPQGSAAPLLLRTRRIAQSALLKAAPYSSCCRRTG